MNTYMINFNSKKCSREILRSLGKVVYESKYMDVLYLSTDMSIDELRNINGIDNVCIEAKGIIDDRIGCYR